MALNLLSTRLIALIERAEIKLYWLAEELRVDRRTVSCWVNGKVRWIKRDNLKTLAKILDCSIDNLTMTTERPDFATNEMDFLRHPYYTSQNLGGLSATLPLYSNCNLPE